MSREDAYKLVQTHAMNAWQNDLNFRELVEADPAITAKLSPQKIAAAFDVPPPTHQHRRGLHPRPRRRLTQPQTPKNLRLSLPFPALTPKVPLSNCLTNERRAYTQLPGHVKRSYHFQLDWQLI